ncbi:hypothetical protein J5751_00225 [bacterium]|nr:hypothetical protein [bacterium]
MLHHFKSVYSCGISVVALAHLSELEPLGQGKDTEKTIQFQTTLPTGSLIAFQISYGQKHIAIPNFKVNVGIKYNLNIDGYVPFCGTKSTNQSPGHLNGYPNIHGNGRYTQYTGHRFPGNVIAGRPDQISSSKKSKL